MVRSPSFDKTENVKKGAWTKEEDELLINYIKQHGEGSWKTLPKAAGLLRCGKSCRLRWINYLRPDLKRGNFTKEEDDVIINLQKIIGNKWSIIASRLPGRTDNEIKNYWNTHIKRRLKDRIIQQQLQPKIIMNTTAVPPFQQAQAVPPFQQAQNFTMQSGDDTINPLAHNILNVVKNDSALSSDYTSSSSSSSSTLLISDQEIKHEVNLELSMGLPQSNDAEKINDKFKIEKKWESYYPQLFGKSLSASSSTPPIPKDSVKLFGKSLSTSSSIRPIEKDPVCLCYNLGGYHNGNSSCQKCVGV